MSGIEKKFCPSEREWRFMTSASCRPGRESCLTGFTWPQQTVKTQESTSFVVPQLASASSPLQPISCVKLPAPCTRHTAPLSAPSLQEDILHRRIDWLVSALVTMDPEVMDVKMFPKSEVPARSSSLQNSEASSQSSEQAAVRTSAIPLPEGQLRNRNVGTETKALPEVPEKQDVDRSSTTSSIDDSQPPNPDLVLLFNTPKPDAPAQETTAAQKEFARLLKSLNEAGLLTSSAPATEGTNQRLVFIKGVQSAIRAEAQKERYVV